MKNSDDNIKNKDLNNLAYMLHDARTQVRPIVQLSKQGIELSRNEAYQVQEAGIRLREKAGEVRVGLKMGLTSEGKRKQMNLDSPLYGELTDKMRVFAGDKINISVHIHSKIEPEIAFLIASELEGDVTREQVLNATGAVCACLEILDSRYDQFKYFSMEDVIADNSSSSHFVLGPWVKDFKNLDLRELKMQMFVDGKVAQEALSSEISGDPVVSVIELCRLLALNGRKLKTGTFVLAGAATPAVPLKPGMQVELKVDQLPAVNVSAAGVKK
ncbi:MAG: fumarylacetoacetate hydrolase family protein [Bdellovibrionota bacterium]